MTKIASFNSEKINTHIVNWLKEYAKTAKVNGFVVGISGGIDSALTSTLCAQTGLPTLCVEMPIHQAKSHVNRANEHIDQLKLRFPNVSNTRSDLTDIFEVFKREMPKFENEETYQLTLANTRARLRMTALYFHAGLHGYLVAGTGNKIEDFGVGFFTKYGDGGVDLSPIGDLMKSEVKLLSAYLNVPQSILNAAPTDGLFGDDRSDEEQIGASYDELEWAMIYLENENKTVLTKRQEIVLEIYRKRNKANFHKINPIPVCSIPKIYAQ